MTETTESKEDPHYIGHRKRLRQRFLVDLGQSMPDYELLEIIFTCAYPRKDMKPLAKKTIKHFGSLSKIIRAEISDLKNFGLSETAIVLLKTIAITNARCSLQQLNESNQPILSDFDLVVDHCRSALSHLSVEEFRVIFLNSSLKIIREKVMQRGTVNNVAVHPREIVKETLDCQATSIILMHNHPGGKCSPSMADRKVTQEIVEALFSLKIDVYDHIIVTEDDYYSFRKNGLL